MDTCAHAMQDGLVPNVQSTLMTAILILVSMEGAVLLDQH